jgi:hypothetical protein
MLQCNYQVYNRDVFIREYINTNNYTQCAVIGKEVLYCLMVGHDQLDRNITDSE